MCNREAASVEAAAQEFGDTAHFVGVAWTGTDSAFQGFIAKHGLTFPQISDDPGRVFARFGVPYQPAMVIVGTDGSAQLFNGAVDEAMLRQVVTDAA